MGHLSLIGNWPELAEAAHFHLPEFAALCGAWPSSLRRFFQREWQTTPGRYLNLCQLAKAVVLLAGGQHNVKDVSVICWYSCPSELTRRFKDFFDMPPSLVHEVDVIKLQELADLVSCEAKRPSIAKQCPSIISRFSCNKGKQVLESVPSKNPYAKPSPPPNSFPDPYRGSYGTSRCQPGYDDQRR